MKKYIFALLLLANSSGCYADQPQKMDIEYEPIIINIKNNIEKTTNPAGLKKEINILLDILLKNIKNAKKEGKNISIIEQRDNTLAERNSQLEKEQPTVFQKILATGDASQWFTGCVNLIGSLTEKLHIERNTVLTKLIKIMRYTNQESVLTSETKQHREKFLNVFEQKLKQANGNINFQEQVAGTFEEMKTQLTTENPIEAEKMFEISDAARYFLEATEYLSLLL